MTETWTTTRSTITIETEYNSGMATSCTLTINGKAYPARYNKVAKTAEIKIDGKPVNVTLPGNVWKAIETAKETSHRPVTMSAEKAAYYKMEETRIEYEKAFNLGVNNMDIIAKRDAWDEATKNYRLV